MLTKLLNVFCITMFSAFLLLNPSLFANDDVLYQIVKAERDVGYVGVRVKTYRSRTTEELVIRESSDASYRKTISIVGEQKSIDQDRPRGQNRVDRENGRDGRRRSRESRWERERSQFSSSEIKLIAENYALEHIPWGEKIAGHETDILIIKPKFEGRPTKYIYFARKNNVILKVQDLDAAGVLRRMFVYTRISFDPDSVKEKLESLTDEIDGNGSRGDTQRNNIISIDDAHKILKKKPILPKYLPAGFKLQRISKHEYRGNHPIRLRFTDGLLDFSIFEMIGKLSSRDEEDRGRIEIQIGEVSVRKHSRGPTHAFSWSNEGIHFFLSGPIPAIEMQKIVESTILQPQQK